MNHLYINATNKKKSELTSQNKQLMTKLLDQMARYLSNVNGTSELDGCSQSSKESEHTQGPQLFLS